MVLQNGNTRDLGYRGRPAGWVGAAAAEGADDAGETVCDGIGTRGISVAVGAVPAAGAAVAVDPGSGCPTDAMSSGWMRAGHSAATAGSMFQRRYFVLST